MTRTRTSAFSDRARDHELSILWGAWAELGLSGWARTHRDWGVDPEPLIIATSPTTDSRLRDEALDWCVHNWRLVSRIRLRNLLRGQPAAVVAAYGRFSATVNMHGGANWPSPTEAYSYRTTGRSTPPVLGRESMVWLRMRAMFGVGARTEILRYFLSHPGRRASVLSLATATGYAKRNLADECTSLQRAGLLSMRRTGNRLYYALDRGEELQALVGEMPAVTPNWSALFRVTRELVAFAGEEERLPIKALNVEAHRAVRNLEEELELLELAVAPVRTDYSIAVRTFTEKTLSAWANGVWP